MLLTTKLRIYPTEPQAAVLGALAERCRLLYNFALQERRTIWKVNKDKSKADRQKITKSASCRISSNIKLII